MTVTDISNENIEWAKRNVQMNQLNNRIKSKLIIENLLKAFKLNRVFKKKFFKIKNVFLK